LSHLRIVPTLKFLWMDSKYFFSYQGTLLNIVDKPNDDKQKSMRDMSIVLMTVTNGQCSLVNLIKLTVLKIIQIRYRQA